MLSVPLNSLQVYSNNNLKISTLSKKDAVNNAFAETGLFTGADAKQNRGFIVYHAGQCICCAILRFIFFDDTISF